MARLVGLKTGEILGYLDDDLMRRVKGRAADAGQTMTQIIDLEEEPRDLPWVAIEYA